MERIFGKNFVYAVDCYEVWRNQKCINQNDVDGEIIGIVYGEQMYFAYTGLGEASFKRPFKIDLTSYNSQILIADDNSLINEDRIQYFNEEFSGTEEPYICHLFCKFGRISYIRFATPQENSTIFCPIADCIYEYYGDMLELGNFSDESLHKIDSLCRNIIQSSNSTHFTISLDDSVNRNMVWNSMISSFKTELQSLFGRKHQFNTSWDTIVALYTEDIIRKYYDTLGYISYFTFNHICEDVYKASVSITTETNVNHSCQLKFKVLFDLIINNSPV